MSALSLVEISIDYMGYVGLAGLDLRAGCALRGLGATRAPWEAGVGAGPAVSKGGARACAPPLSHLR